MKNLIKCIKGAYELHTAKEESELNQAHIKLTRTERLVLNSYMNISIVYLKTKIYLFKKWLKYDLEITCISIMIISALLVKYLRSTY